LKACRNMERVTISVSEEFAAELTEFMQAHGYSNRSEAIRDLARIGLERSKSDPAREDGACVATLSYVYDHHKRELSKRLTHAHHSHHDLQVATMHVHLDHESCLEVAVLRGPIRAVQEFGKSVIAERGVTYGAISLVPVDIDAGSHSHGSGRHAHSHAHPKG
jgi:CopG family transcriptional regulator, nickel-responsive regulator